MKKKRARNVTSGYDPRFVAARNRALVLAAELLDPCDPELADECRSHIMQVACAANCGHVVAPMREHKKYCSPQCQRRAGFARWVARQSAVRAEKPKKGRKR